MICQPEFTDKIPSRPPQAVQSPNVVIRWVTSSRLKAGFKAFLITSFSARFSTNICLRRRFSSSRFNIRRPDYAGYLQYHIDWVRLYKLSRSWGQFKNDEHYFCGAGVNRPDGWNEPMTIWCWIKHIKISQSHQSMYRLSGSVSAPYTERAAGMALPPCWRTPVMEHSSHQ